jgi:DNA-binding XRE family transcriptional regulator/tetratricopeptide (TPR) repeat protein
MVTSALAQRRKALGLTQEQLADLLNVDRSTVARWERGKAQPLPSLQRKLASVLKLSPERIQAVLTGPDFPRPGETPATASAAPRQLPAGVAGFTGRVAEMKTLTRMLAAAGPGAPGTVVITAIGGSAGVGKTTLALHWAHQVAGRFPGGQLYVDLRGFDPTGIPATPEEAIHGFLDALGVPAGKIPPAADSRAELYRGLVADRKMLIVLDNARDEQQVRPLLPANPGSLALVTSRNQLTGLAADGARLLCLDVLPCAEAIQLLACRVSASRAAAEPDAVNDIAALCSCLPLALAIAGACAAARPGFPLAGLAAELRDVAGRLDALDAGDQAASVRAVFSWSYRQLDAEAARMFRLLGVHPGPDISLLAAASLAATSQAGALRLLCELTRGCLLTEHVPGRYSFHDLLRAYAGDLARDSDSDAERAAAIGRVLDHYLHTASSAVFLLNPSYEQISVAPARPGVALGRAADDKEALAWFQAEHQVLVAAVALADSSGFDRHAWQLPWAMTAFMEIRGRYLDWAATTRMAVAAATRLRDTAGLATSSRLLANARTEAGDYEHALGYYETSLKLYQELGNRLGEGKAHMHLAVLTERQGDYGTALNHASQALRLFREMGLKAGEADALNAVGWCHGLIGDARHAAGELTQAREAWQQALAILDDLGHPDAGKVRVKLTGGR